jgi:hypothetical protein
MARSPHSLRQSCTRTCVWPDFYRSGGVVWISYGVSGGKQGDTAQIQWIDQTGEVAVEFNWGPAPSDYDKWVFCWDIAIGQGTTLGTWSVQLVTNGIINFNVPFTIGAAVINAPTTTGIGTAAYCPVPQFRRYRLH